MSDGALDTDVRITRIGATLSEEVNRHVALGLLLGYASASQTGQPLTAGMRLSGNYLGLNMQARMPLAQRLRAGLTGQYLYHWMREQLDGQRVEWEWAQADVALTAQIDLTRRLLMYAGPIMSWIEVDQQARGLANLTNELENRRTSGVAFGLLYEVDYGGRVGLEIRRGPLDGLALSFQRNF